MHEDTWRFLGGHIDLISEEGSVVPEPITLELVMEDRENREGASITVPVTVKRPASTVRVNVTLPEDGLASIDARGESKGMNPLGVPGLCSQAADVSA